MELRNGGNFLIMQLDRKLQHNVLEALAEVYPDSLLVSSLPGFSNGRKFMGTLFYLQEHGLIVGGDIREPGQCRSMVDTQITKTGLDFLADDGGLQAMLGRFNVKFYSNELVDIIADSLKKSTIESSRRKGVVASLDSLEPDAMQKLTEELIAESVIEDHERLLSLLNDK